MDLSPEESALTAEVARALHTLLSAAHDVDTKTVRVEESAPSSGYHLMAQFQTTELQHVKLCILCWNQVSATRFGLLAAALADRMPGTAVLASPQISPGLAEVCKKNGWGWLDLEGNARIHRGKTFMLQSGTTLKSKTTRSRPRTHSFVKSRIFRALLIPENARQPWTQLGIQRHLAETQPDVPPPSVGLINRVVQSLFRQKLLNPIDKRHFSVSNFESLLKFWLQMDSETARPSPRKRRYYIPGDPHTWLEKLGAHCQSRVALARHAAAVFQGASIPEL